MRCKNPIKIGATFSIDIQRISSGEPIDITGMEIESTLKHPKFGEYEMEIEMVDPVEGQFRLVLDADTTADILPGDYLWDLSFTDSSGNVEIFPKDNDVVITFIKGATK